MPDRGVTSEQLGIFLSRRDYRISFREGKGALLGFDSVPFLRVSCGYLAKLGVVAQNGNVGGVAELSIVGCGTKILQALLIVSMRLVSGGKGYSQPL